MKKQFIGIAASLIDDIKDSLYRISSKNQEKIPDLEIDLISQQIISLYDAVQRVKKMNLSPPPGREPQPKPEFVQKEELPSIEEKSTQELKPTVIPTEPEAVAPSAEVGSSSETRQDPEEIEEEMQKEDVKESIIEIEAKDEVISKENSLNEATREAVKEVEDKITPDKESEPEIDPEAGEKAKEINSNYLQEEKKMLYEKYAGGRVSLNDRIGKPQPGRSEKMQLTPISDLKTAINLNKKIAFVNELFDGNQKEYKKAIDFINDSHNYSEAKFYTQAELKDKFNWDESNDLVKEFMELIYRKFI